MPTVRTFHTNTPFPGEEMPQWRGNCCGCRSNICQVLAVLPPSLPHACGPSSICTVLHLHPLVSEVQLFFKLVLTRLYMQHAMHSHGMLPM